MPVNVSVTVAHFFSLRSLLFSFFFKLVFVFPMLPRVAVDCGFPSIPKDGVLQVVETHRRHTLYKDQIQFECNSKYYTLEGPGN